MKRQIFYGYLLVIVTVIGFATVLAEKQTVTIIAETQSTTVTDDEQHLQPLDIQRAKANLEPKAVLCTSALYMAMAQNLILQNELSLRDNTTDERVEMLSEKIDYAWEISYEDCADAILTLQKVQGSHKPDSHADSDLHLLRHKLCFNMFLIGKNVPDEEKTYYGDELLEKGKQALAACRTPTDKKVEKEPPEKEQPGIDI